MSLCKAIGRQLASETALVRGSVEEVTHILYDTLFANTDNPQFDPCIATEQEVDAADGKISFQYFNHEYRVDISQVDIDNPELLKLPKNGLLDVLKAYDAYIAAACEEKRFESGWMPVGITEFIQNEYQLNWLNRENDDCFLVAGYEECSDCFVCAKDTDGCKYEESLKTIAPLGVRNE